MLLNMSLPVILPVSDEELQYVHLSTSLSEIGTFRELPFPHTEIVRWIYSVIHRFNVGVPVSIVTARSCTMVSIYRSHELDTR